ncbi:hypothetical protein Poly24_55150 [Rosistilla carotiformis]|uniref:Uncharacterized protein n=1 Tax=Rosistilla carotiformis TaxID=2528017 RepID=A0A518K1Y7_9BACT|nr:hypothetical protein [Rosistilla carotiformis]QDV71775.1 hypothetical protein Poly24_55150 [Rosistilla carotiformis]
MPTENRTQQRNPSTNAVHNQVEAATHSAAESIQEYGSHYVAEPAKDIFALLSDYAKDRPDVMAVWSFGLGVVVGWKLRG